MMEFNVNFIINYLYLMGIWMKYQITLNLLEFVKKQSISSTYKFNYNSITDLSLTLFNFM